MITKPGGVRIGLNIPYERLFRFDNTAGLAPTDGVGYSGVITFGTTTTEILNELIDPGFSLRLQQIEIGLTQQFTELTNVVGSLVYNWEAREEWTDPSGATGPQLKTGSWLPITASYSKSVGSLASSEDTFSNYIPVASLPHAPIRLRLRAKGLVPSTMTGRIKNSSYIQLIGNVIPGT